MKNNESVNVRAIPLMEPSVLVKNEMHYDTKPIWRMVGHIVLGMLALYGLFALVAFLVSMAN